VINERQTIRGAVKEARGRFDGIVALFCMAVALATPFICLIYRYLREDKFSFNVTAAFLPVVIFLLYIKFRQLDADDAFWRQCLNALIIFLSSIALTYGLNF
jgi:hypothetical protein